jgi:L-threonylcarbamoyladenylate synthase
MRLPFSTDAEIHSAMPRVLEHLAADRLIAYPTETVYGFGGVVSPAAVAALSALKRREPLKPFLLLLLVPEQAPGVQWTDAARTVARAFWPGPLTLVLPAAETAFPAGIRTSDGTVALRASPHAAVLALLAALDAPLTSSSANAPGAAPARDAGEVARALAELDATDVLILDGGRLPQSQPSTVVAVADSTLRVLRAGAVSDDELRTRLRGTGIHVA